MEQKYIFEGQEIDLNHHLFDVFVFDEELGRVIEVVTEEQVLQAKLKKANHMLEHGQIKLAPEKQDVLAPEKQDVLAPEKQDVEVVKEEDKPKKK